jgi:hypothetical protein
MTLKSYIWGIRISTAISFVACALVIMQIDPEKTGIIGQFLFFISAMLFLSGLFVLFFTWLRRKALSEGDMKFSHLGISFRQGILMALLVVLFLILQQYRVLTWWDGALTVVGILLIELYFLTRR